MFPFPGSSRLARQGFNPVRRDAENFGYEMVRFDNENINIFAAQLCRCEPHWHSASEFMFVLDGGFAVTVNATMVELRTGGMIFINSDEIHSLESLGPNGIVLTVQFSPELFAAIGRKLNIQYSVASSPDYGEKDAAVARLLAEVLGDSLSGSATDPFRRMSSIYMLLSELGNAGTTVDESDAASFRRDDQLLVKDGIEYINSHYAEDLSLDRLAKRACLSYHHYSRMFKKYSGYNFKDYLNYVRVNKARFLLKNTHVPITEISYLCGFSEHKYFIAVFRKYHAMTPTEFRKNYVLETNQNHYEAADGFEHHEVLLSPDLLKKVVNM